MNMNQREIKFENFVTLQRGFDLPKIHMKDGEVPVLGSNCIIGYHNEAKVDPPGVVTGRSGTLGLVQYTEVAHWPHNTALWVKDFKGNYPKYVYYKLQTLHLERFNGGVSIPTLNRNVLDTLPITVPVFNVQKRIADIISAYDDLIENNRRRIQLLEQAARMLYKEWFVKLRFPGHEHVKIVDGVPEGWVKGKIADLAEVKSGFAFKSRDWQTLGHPVIKIKNIVGNGSIDIISCDCIDDVVANEASNFIICPGNLLIAMTGATIGKIGLMPRTNKHFYLNQRVGILKSCSIALIEYFLYPFFMDINAQTQVQNIAAGAAQPNISGSHIESIEILIPSRNLLNHYIDKVKDCFALRQILIEQKTKLKDARDLLLPRLMNGEMTV